MDESKVRFLFGQDLGGRNPDNPEDRAALLAEANPELQSQDLVIREGVATQIARGQPRAVWATARTLLVGGLAPSEIMDQLTFAFGHAANTAARNDLPLDEEAYIASLESLPLPQPAEVGPVVIEVVRERPGISGEDLDRLALDRLGRSEDDELATDLIGRVAEALTHGEEPLAWLGGDRTVHVADLMAGAILTHRISPGEAATGVLETLDFSPFNRLAPLALAGEAGPGGDQEITLLEDGQELVLWDGPPGWLDPYPPGTLVALRVSRPAPGEGSGARVAITPVAEPEADALLVSRVRQAYTREVDDSDLPASLEEIALGLALEDPGTFRVARPPLTELCSLAGLERRGDMVAHDPAYWKHQYRLEGLRRVFDFFDKDDERMAVLQALDVADSPDTGTAEVQKAIAGMRDADIFAFVLDELFGPDDEAALLSDAVAFSERLLREARRPAEVAVAQLLAAVVQERRGEILRAEPHIHQALDADPDWAPALLRAGWYAFDRGDAAEAVRQWRRMADPPEKIGLAQEILQDASAGHTGLGRNDPCWCGSGRKFKVCHLGRPSRPPLEERFDWLCAKATSFLDHRGVGADADLLRHAEAWAMNEDADTIAEALNDPMVVDVTLVESGWFARFLDERGPLLPDDEATLAASWVGIDRTVYKVTEVDRGEWLVVQDVRDGKPVRVRDPYLARIAFPGHLLCGRAVPDGRQHQFMGRVFAVIPGTEDDVLGFCTEGNTEALCEYVGVCVRAQTKAQDGHRDRLTDDELGHILAAERQDG